MFKSGKEFEYIAGLDFVPYFIVFF